MLTLREAAQQAKQAPLRELLASVPADARLVIDDADGKGTRFIPVGRLCREAAAALAEPVQEPPEFPPHDDKVHAGAVYWYVGTDGKYYSSNEVKLFMETKNKSLHYEPPKWVLDNFDLIPLYTAPPQPEECNFCSRCGKRTNDIHTCTPP